ncbi:MAG: hypothetical protein ACK4S4_02570 [Pyrinomonadaceae bacterium]
MIELFTQLGVEIEDRWRAIDYDETRFPALAAEALRQAELPAKVSAWDVLEWTLAQRELPRQMDVPARFGDPPITLFVAPRFYIDVYFWFQGTTSVHQHAFCGAFQVLHGSSIHSWYEFEADESVNAFMEFGRMGLKVCELLERGDVHEIRAGRQYIHSLFHLDHPSATIVVRTGKSPLFLPQYDYHKPWIASDPFFEHETTVKKLQTISAVMRFDAERADDAIVRLLADSDIHTTFLLLSNIYGRVGGSGLGEMFGLAAPGRGRFQRFLDAVTERHGPERAAKLSDVFRHRERIDELIGRRAVVTDPEHRFFLALLLNVEGRERIYSLIRERFADADPEEKVLDWSFDLARTRINAVGSQNALGIADFDDFDLYVLEALLDDKDEAVIAGSIRAEYPPERAETLLPRLSERIAAIRSSTAFAPLLAGRDAS